MAEKTLYRITFVNQGKLYELYARQVFQGDLYGFVGIEELVFGSADQLVVDPGEERLKDEFAHVVRSFIPLHSVIRIDQVHKQGTAKIHEFDGDGGVVMPFPGQPLPGGDKPGGKGPGGR